MKQFLRFFYFLLVGLIFTQASYAQFNEASNSALILKSGKDSLLGTCAYCNNGNLKNAAPPPNPLNGTGTLGNTYDNTACGLNYVYGSVKITTRYATPAGLGNPATIAIAGIPAGCVVIDKAYLWYIASYTEGSAPASTVQFTNPVPATATYSSTIIGTGPSKCWGESGTAIYRADVTAAISGNGTYKLNLTGFSNASSEVDGAALIIVYKNTAAAYQGTLVIADGCIVNTGAATTSYTLNGFTACAASPTASAFVVTSDMQSNVNGGNHTSTLNGGTATYPNNFFNFDKTNTTVTNGQTTSAFSTADNGDCYAWALVGLYYQTSCVVCSSPTLTLAMSSTSATCGNSNGTATVIATGGTAPYTYSWSPGGQTTSTATGLSAGTYTVTVSDASGCNTATNTVVVTNSGGITATVTSTSISCFDGSNGTAVVTPAGGTGPYTYSWNPSGQTTQTATGLSATTYTVTVTDAGGCNTIATVTPTQPNAINITTTPTPTSCSTSLNGSISSLVTGGTGAYTYSWTPTGESTATATGLGAGTYTVTVTDAAGCTQTATGVITSPPAIVLATSTTTAHCSIADGSATGSATGGTGAYTYSWSNGATTALDNNIVSGSYTLTLTDANGCTQTAVAVVPNAGGPSATITSVTNVTCFGASNGSLTVTATSGITPYTYSWNPAGQTTATATGLASGSYTVTVTDANGCNTTVSGVITEPAALDTTTSYVNILCNGGNNGSATVNVTGGTGAYTYVWTPNVSTTNTANGLTAGTYVVTITDANGCSISKTFVITEPPLLKASAAGFPATCHGSCNGYAVVIPSGGMGAYIYSWTPSGNTTANANNLCSGTYCIKVTDANGCIVDTCVTVTSPTAISLVTSTMTSHCGQADGSATVTASGGTPATIGPGYTYLWTPSGQATATATGLTPGNYCVTVKDTNNCPDTICVVVPDAPGVVASISGSTNVSCFGTCDGTATGLATGGTAPYTYSWSTVPSQATATATGLCAGLYTVSISDGTGCNSSASVTITQPTQVTVTPSAAITICIGQSTTLSATALGGTPAYNYTWNTTVNGQDYTVSPTTSPTTYTVVATDANGCQSTPQTVTVTLNPPLSVTAEHDTSLCLGGHATLTAQGTGGNGSYNYVWQPGALSGSPISVTPTATTTYTVTVTDNCGTPPATNTVTVTVNPLPTVSFSADSVSGCYPLCVTFSNLSTPASASANWEFGDGNTASTTMTGHNCYETSGSYNVTLTVTDSLGCSNTSTINNMILVYPHPTANFSMSPTPVTILEPTVYFTDASTGGVTEWEWNMGDVPNSGSNVENPQYTYPDTGYYNVELIVTDNHGCKDSITKTVYVEGEYVIYVPNAFTPNGDGINDTFYPKGTGIDPNNYQMYIFDRWGNMIFYTNILSQGWDGRVQGDSKLVQEDVYVWKIITKDPQGKSHQYIGHVSVVR